MYDRKDQNAEPHRNELECGATPKEASLIYCIANNHKTHGNYLISTTSRTSLRLPVVSRSGIQWTIQESRMVTKMQ